MKLLHPISRCQFMACVKHKTASRVLRFASYANWYGSLGRVVMEPISLNSSDPRTLRGTELQAIGRIFGQAAVDDFNKSKFNNLIYKRSKIHSQPCSLFYVDVLHGIL